MRPGEQQALMAQASLLRGGAATATGKSATKSAKSGSKKATKGGGVDPRKGDLGPLPAAATGGSGGVGEQAGQQARGKGTSEVQVGEDGLGAGGAAGGSKRIRSGGRGRGTGGKASGGAGRSRGRGKARGGGREREGGEGEGEEEGGVAGMQHTHTAAAAAAALAMTVDNHPGKDQPDAQDSEAQLPGNKKHPNTNDNQATGQRMEPGPSNVALGVPDTVTFQAAGSPLLAGVHFYALDAHQGGVLWALRPTTIIMYDPDLTFLRQVGGVVDGWLVVVGSGWVVCC